MDCTVGYTHVRVFTIQILDTVNMRSMVPGGCLCMTKVLGLKFLETSMSRDLSPWIYSKPIAVNAVLFVFYVDYKFKNI
jgi:hypothetical protein